MHIEIDGPETAVDLRRHDRAGGGLHQRAVPPAGQPAELRRRLERGAVPRRASSWRSAPTRRSCSARSCGARRASRCSSRHRHPARGAARHRAFGRGCGSASGGSPRSSTSSRRTCRYFPALLPVCDAEDPVEVLERGDTPRTAANCGCTTAPSTAGTGRCTTSSAACRTCGSRTGYCPPGRPSSTCWPTARSTTACCECSPRRTARSGRRCRSRPRRRTSRPGRQARHRRPACTGRVSARCRPPNWCCGGCCRWPTRAWQRGVWTRRVSDRLLGIIEQRCTTAGRTAQSGRRAMFHTIDDEKQPLDRRDALREMLRRYVEHMHTTSPSTPGRR